MLKFFIILYFFLFNMCFVIAKINLHIRNREPVVPVKEDLEKFLEPIETLTNYTSINITDIEINFALGLFFINVHLGHVLTFKGQNISNDIKSRIKTIFDTNERSLLYFHKRAKSDIDFMSRDHVIMIDLFVNSTYWINRLKNFTYKTQPKYTRNDLELNYSEWNKYYDNVDHVFKWIPNPKNSDICMVTLAINPKNRGNITGWCPIAKKCYTILNEGTNFGYALCHRLALLLMAELGRGCSILSALEDEQLKEKFCTMAYAEAEYIAMNYYGIADLMLEIMCLCSMDGRLQFLKRTWLYKMFDFQNANGCFGVENVAIPQRRTRIGTCNSHTTILASATYAAAVRFILEKYY